MKTYRIRIKDNESKQVETRQIKAVDLRNALIQAFSDYARENIYNDADMIDIQEHNDIIYTLSDMSAPGMIQRELKDEMNLELFEEDEEGLVTVQVKSSAEELKASEYEIPQPRTFEGKK